MAAPAPGNLLDSLTLERIEVNLFRGLSPLTGGSAGRIYGGLVIAQALLAAYRTVEAHVCHSLHCYFLRPGDPKIPILYEVDRARDGRSFVSRRVTAIQNGQQIFNLASSFQAPEAGVEHQDTMPDVPPPESLGEAFGLSPAVAASLPDAAAAAPRPIELRAVDPANYDDLRPMAPRQHVWMRATAPLPDEVAMHQAALAYASDMNLMGTGMRPHALSWRTPDLQHATIDHAMWFHRPSNFNDWHLYAMTSPSASGARGFNLGQIFTRDGRLVASAAQEGLMRRRVPTQT